MDEAALLRAAITDAPDEDAPRLVYADWLTARGDPRGEYIALELRGIAEKNEDLRAQAARLLAWHPGWIPVAPVGARWSMRSGLPQVLTTDASTWLAHRRELAVPLLSDLRIGDLDGPPDELADSLVGLPLGSLSLGGETDWLPFAQIFDHPAAGRLHELKLRRDVAPAVVGTVGSSPHLARLERLDLDLGEEAAEALGRSAGLPGLDDLVLYGPTRPILDWPRLRTISKLRLDAGAMFDVDQLFATELPSLRDLQLASPQLSRRPRWVGQLESLRLHEGAPRLSREVAGWPFGGLKRLALTVDEVGAQALARAPALAGLEELEVELASPTVRPLVEDPVWRGLRSLTLYGEEGAPELDLADELARSPLRLRSLTIRRVVGAGFARRAPELDALAALESLSIGWAPVGNAGAAALARMPLRSLSLTACEIGAEGARAIARAPALEHLRHLYLGGNPHIGQEARAEVEARFGPVR